MTVTYRDVEDPLESIEVTGTLAVSTIAGVVSVTPSSVDDRYRYAIAKVLADYGDTISVASKLKDLTKFGENQNIGTSLTTIMTLPSGVSSETLSTSSNNIVSIISSNAGDTGTVTIEGHYFSGTDLIFTIQSATLTGQTAVTLTTALSRVTRVYSTSAISFSGDVAVYEGGTTTSGVPDTAASVHLIVKAGEAQSQKASTSISSTDYWLLESMTASVLEKVNSWAQVRIETKPATSNIWRPVMQYVGVSDSTGTTGAIFDPILIVPKNYDIRMVSKANAANTHVAGGMRGILAAVTS